MPVINPRKIPRYKAPRPSEREIGVVLAPEIGNYDKATVAVVQLPPEGNTGLHKHEGSDEIIYVSSGEGEFIEVINEKELVSEIRPGYLMVAKSGTIHMVKNTGSTHLELFCVFIPPIAQPTPALAEAINRAREYFS
ncbi:MAG: cupin domain-containing protein [Desulfurococcaceae archaeon]